eukprot:TRINITY_DN65230_c0_g1_i1.p1 TRINITY_DN65230_c0_g1~~TRINITY_DN65230_c0_g1_i1.p1  ORF type:complete len:294 (+),score=70.71 TRINITY_DN65230_c0_g1_i1:60-884(+)
MATPAWLAKEALRLEEHAGGLERSGNVAEALLQYRRAVVKLTEASALCGQGDSDRVALEEHAQEVSLRMVYLESLQGGPATIPIDDHIGPLEVVMDLAIAVPNPADEDVSKLVARSGVSGSQATLDEAGYQLVAALRSNSEMGVFVGRVLDLDGRGIKGGGEAELSAFLPRYSGTEAVQSYAALRDELRLARWVAPKVGKDKMDGAVALEKQAREFDAAHRKEDAVLKYADAIQMFQYVCKYDDRAKNPKIKDMLSKRIEELQVRMAEIKLSGM